MQGFKLQALFTAPSNYNDNGLQSFRSVVYSRVYMIYRFLHPLALTHYLPISYSIGSLLIYGGIYWFLAAVTYGAFIPSGLFTPSLILGTF